MRNTADVTGGKPIAVLLPFISCLCAINPLGAFYDIILTQYDEFSESFKKRNYPLPLLTWANIYNALNEPCQGTAGAHV
jgi:hypothetical protein